MAGREARRVDVAIGEEQSVMDPLLVYRAQLARKVAIMSSVHSSNLSVEGRALSLCSEVRLIIVL